MNQRYKKKGFIIFPEGKDFIVYNTNMNFKEAHTHVKSFKIGRTLIYLAIKRKLPKNPYLATSLIRISNDKDYIQKLKELKEIIMTRRDFERMLTERSEIDTSKCT